MVGTGKGAENGLLIKGGEYLEKAHKLTTVVFDKTGTLTRGKPSLTDVRAIGTIREDEILRLSASAEKGSEHPLGEAIVRAASERGLAVEDPEDFEAIPGQGIRARVQGRAVLLGNRRLFEAAGIRFAGAEAAIQAIESEGKTAMLLSVDGEVAGVIGVADTLKDHAVETVRALTAMDIQVIMLTVTTDGPRRRSRVRPESTGSSRRSRPAKRQRRSRNSRHKVGSLRWSAMASTMPRPWPRVTWGSPSEAARMWRWRRAASC